MNLKEAALALSSLSQETRLKAFKMLVRAGFDGMLAGEVSKKMDVPQNTMSFHLAHLEKNKLIKKSKSGRCITYTANFKAMEGLIKFLFKNCCEDSSQKSSVNPEILNICKKK